LRCAAHHPYAKEALKQRTRDVRQRLFSRRQALYFKDRKDFFDALEVIRVD
jgi:hypothetical protein